MEKGGGTNMTVSIGRSARKVVLSPQKNFWRVNWPIGGVYDKDVGSKQGERGKRMTPLEKGGNLVRRL